MNGFAIALMVLVIPGCDRDPTLDKIETTRSPIGVVGAKTLKKQEPALAGSFSAERAGYCFGLRTRCGPRRSYGTMSSYLNTLQQISNAQQ